MTIFSNLAIIGSTKVIEEQTPEDAKQEESAMLKEWTKRLPFMQASGKRTKPREKAEPAPEPPARTPAGEDAEETESLWEEQPSPAGPEEPAPKEPAPSEPQACSSGRDLKMGLAACREKDYGTALQAFLRAAELGSLEAQFLCGQMYQRGLSVEADDKQALLWYKRAAKQGFIHAQTACAALYEEGRGTEMDLKRALFWYEQAAKQGAVDAQLKCGVMYSCGRADTRNPKKARRWLETAADNGSEEARRILAERF